ncbi:MAG: hypothetical protein F9K24_17745 [Leptonema illini]|uniref:NAD(P)-binding domain-containing protein n=1 Tax=Leptonema illini TaxID=183 RepID=A0A833LZY2_9LEPT|nr:MAG: hypothetical protein F9K24_17745 [Leptonema illini]
MRSRSILITEGVGFIGSHFILHLLKQNSDVHVVNLDALTARQRPPPTGWYLRPNHTQSR